MADKASKEDVGYTPYGTPREHCALCTMYVNPTTCSAVIGKIDPEGWCELFERKKK